MGASGVLSLYEFGKISGFPGVLFLKELGRILRDQVFERIMGASGALFLYEFEKYSGVIGVLYLKDLERILGDPSVLFLKECERISTIPDVFSYMYSKKFLGYLMFYFWKNQKKSRLCFGFEEIRKNPGGF